MNLFLGRSLTMKTTLKIALPVAALLAAVTLAGPPA